MARKLNQVIAVEKGVKSRVYGQVSETFKVLQKPDQFSGFSKVYEPTADDGETFPPESKRVQHTGKALLEQTAAQLTELFQVTAEKDFTNTSAKADVIVETDKGPVTIVTGAPVGYLLFLEKQLTDLVAFIKALPLLSADEEWAWDANSGLYKTGSLSTHRTKKVQKPIVLYNATPEHPAQTQLITEDIIVGHWQTVKLSGAVPPTVAANLLTRVQSVLKAVKEAREAANAEAVATVPDVGDALFTFLLS